MDTSTKQTKQVNSSINIDFDSGFTINGITGIIENNENGFVASVGGIILSISGSKFNLDSFDLENKSAKVSGKLTSLKLSKTREKVSALKRIFK